MNPTGIIRSLVADTTSRAKFDLAFLWNAWNASRALAAPSGKGGQPSR